MTDLDDGWQRLHPLTPLLRGGRFLLVLAAIVGQQGVRQADSLGPTTTGLLVLAGTAAAVLVGLIIWRTTRYRVTDTELQVESGILQRRSRRVPLARVQTVDLVRPIVARVLGLTELRLEVVGGGGTEAPLAYLTEAHGEALRRQLLAAAAGRRHLPEQVEPPEALLVAVPTWTLVRSALLGGPLVATVGFALVVLGTAAISLSATAPVLLAALPAYAGFITVAVRRLLTEYDFTVSETPDGLRLRHGLLDTRSQTIPYGRVQAVRILQPLLWRHWGWVRVEVDVAGYAGSREEQQAGTAALLPVAPRVLAEALVGRVLGGVLPRAAASVPDRVRWRAPLQRHRLAAGLDDRHLVTTHGVLTTTTDVVPLAKVQSVRLTAGPWQQRLRLASVHADTAGRRLTSGVAQHRDAEEARALLAELAARARAARRAAPR